MRGTASINGTIHLFELKGCPCLRERQCLGARASYPRLSFLSIKIRRPQILPSFSSVAFADDPPQGSMVCPFLITEQGLGPLIWRANESESASTPHRQPGGPPPPRLLLWGKYSKSMILMASPSIWGFSAWIPEYQLFADMRWGC